MNQTEQEHRSTGRKSLWQLQSKVTVNRGGIDEGVFECWGHPATYLTYWLCVKSHPLDTAARCVHWLFIAGRPPSLTPHAAVRNLWSMLYPPALSSVSTAPPQLSSDTIQPCVGKTWGIAYYKFMAEALKQPCLTPLCGVQDFLAVIVGRDTYHVLKMSQVWIQLVTFVECHISGALNRSSFFAAVFFSKAQMSCVQEIKNMWQVDSS